MSPSPVGYSCPCAPAAMKAGREWCWSCLSRSRALRAISKKQDASPYGVLRPREKVQGEVRKGEEQNPSYQSRCQVERAKRERMTVGPPTSMYVSQRATVAGTSGWAIVLHAFVVYSFCRCFVCAVTLKVVFPPKNYGQ